MCVFVCVFVCVCVCLCLCVFLRVCVGGGYGGVGVCDCSRRDFVLTIIKAMIAALTKKRNYNTYELFIFKSSDNRCCVPAVGFELGAR